MPRPWLAAAALLLAGCAQSGALGAAAAGGAVVEPAPGAHPASFACQASARSLRLGPGPASSRALKEAERWCGWSQQLERMQARLDGELRARAAEAGPFESEDADWFSSPLADAAKGTSAPPGASGDTDPAPAPSRPSPEPDDGPAAASEIAAAASAAGPKLTRLYHERLVLVVARLWIDQATGCLVPVGARDAPACGAKAWAAAIESADSLSAFLQQVDLHVSELRANRSEADRFAYGGEGGLALDGVLDIPAAERQSWTDGRSGGRATGHGRGGGPHDALAGPTGGKAKVSRRARLDISGKREPADEKEAFHAEAPAEGYCAPGDPLCGWDEEPDAADLLPPAPPAATSRAPAPSTPRPDGQGGVRGAVVEPSQALLDGVMPAVRSRLTEIGACLPEPTGADATLRLDVRVRVAADGSLRDVQVGPASELPPTAASCVTRILHDLRVPAPSDGGSHVVTFPLWMANR